MDRATLEMCKEFNIKRYRSSMNELEVEFFEPKPKTQDIDTVALTKALADPMPPDSAMMFAAVDDPAPEPQLPEVPSA